MTESTQIEQWWMPGKDRDIVEKSLIAQLGASKGLKPFSSIAQKLLELLRSKEYSVDAAAKMCESDPALASNLLRMSNSALYKGVSATASIKEAVVRMGARVVEEIVLASQAAGLFVDSSGAGAVYRDHCAGTAALARFFSEKLHPNPLESIFLCGLMHDMGKLIFLQAGQKFYKKTLDASPLREADRIYKDEQREIGYDHALLGAHLLGFWKIPEPVPSIVATHHRWDEVKGRSELITKVALVRLANRLEPRLAYASQAAFEEEALVAEDWEETKALGITSQQTLLDWYPEMLKVRQDTIQIIQSLRR